MTKIKITKFEFDKLKIQKKFKNDKVGMFLAETCAKYMDKFVPMDTGMLAQNFTVEPFVVTYTQPYAHYQFNGTNFNFSKDKHPNATARWDKAASRQHGKDIAMELEQYLNR